MRRALSALAPGAILIVALGLTYRFAPEWTEDGLAETYGPVVYVGGLVLAAVFHRSRAVIAFGLLGALDYWVVGAADRSELVVPLGTFALALLGLLALVRDRGVVSRVGALQVLAAVALAAVAGALALFRGRLPEVVGSLRDGVVDVLPEAWLTGAAWAGFPRITLMVAIFAALAVAYGIQRYRGPVERGLLWSGLLLLAAMHESVPGERASFLLVGAGVGMVLALVRTSYAMAYRDELTGLPGRRALMQYLDDVQGTYTVAMVDVDHFKKFNDRHGHDVGDQVLKLVASRLARAPGGGRAYRYGGEEFTLLYPGRVMEDALPHLEKVRRSIDDATFSLRSWRRPRAKPPEGKKKKRKGRRPRKLSVTVSIGMAHTGGADSDPMAVLKKADEALYRAKSRGRNRVEK